MKQILFSGKARQDLLAIKTYTESLWSARQSIYYRDMLLDECFSIPEREVIISYPTYKTYSYTHCGQHFIFFQSTENGIRIARILHEKMSFANHL